MGGLGLLPFIATVLMISLSGALMPGPVTAVTVARGATNPHAGAWVAIGHGVIEFPLMALIYFGVSAWFEVLAVKIGLGLAGGGVLFWMGLGMLRDCRKPLVSAETPVAKTRSPFLAGIMLSAINPYFLIWWATAGAALISQSRGLGTMGFVVLAVAHWSCDLAWLYLLSGLSFRGHKFFGPRLQQGVFILCGTVLLGFGGFFVSGAIQLLWGRS